MSKININSFFKKQLESYFKQDSEEMLKCFEYPHKQSLVLNYLKSKDVLEDISFPLEINPIFKDLGYDYSFDSIGKTLEYHLGLVYPKDLASAVAPHVLNVEKDSVVLDFCSGPGGKACQLANSLAETGYLILNEVVHSRAIQELSNVERMGFSNYLLLNEDPKKLSEELKNKVDYCLVDAPCSGEGMIRKYPDILHELSDIYYLTCQKRQLIILDYAYECLKPGATLCYSTCTYNPLENEVVIARFLKKYPDMYPVSIDFKGGRINDESFGFDLSSTRLFTPLEGGEGQFVCLLRKEGTLNKDNLLKLEKDEKYPEIRKLIDQVIDCPEYYLNVIGKQIFMSFKPFISTNSKVIRQGILVGEYKSNFIYYHHHFFRCNKLRPYFRNVYELSLVEAYAFLKGLEIEYSGDYKGYSLLTYKGYSLGFGRSSVGRIKNKYPKGLRINN